MSASQGFANYPVAQTGPLVPYEPKKDSNPVLQGLPLLVASSVASSFSLLSKYLWGNAGFGSVRHLPGLDQYNPRFSPTVIPLWDGTSSRDMVPFTADQLAVRPVDKPARYWSTADFHAAYKSGVVTPLQVVEAILPLTKRGQKPPSPYEAAWVDTYEGCDEIVLAAARASAARWAAGKPIGLLDGVPFAVKDDVNVKGFVNHNGMRYQPSELFFRPRETSAWPVRALEQAGAVMVGKLAMHPLGCDVNGCNPIWGTPTNFHNPSYYPGGSSSGPASATCAGLIPFCVATDAGGSLRVPASFNGLFALKPSHNRIAIHPTSMCVTGPLACTARDLAIAYRVMAQPNLDDPVQASFARSVPPAPGSKRWLGIYRAWWSRSDDRVAEVCQRALDRVAERAGYQVIEVKIPYVDVGQLAHAATCLAEGSDVCRTRTNRPADWLSIVPPAPKILLSVGAHTSAADYIKYGQLRELLMQHMAALFRDHPGLLLVTPTTAVAGWRRRPAEASHGFTDGNTTMSAMRYVWLANTTGCPAVSTPAGYLDPQDGSAGRLPVGLMAMAEWGAEEALLQFAADVEAYLESDYDGGHVRPDGWVDVIGLGKSRVGQPEADGRALIG